MYGLVGDDKPMSHLFESSHRRWSEVAAGMGAAYHMWNAAEVESLVKQRYPQYWDMYCGVRYPIMRCAIGRLCILHNYGGLYSDLNILPNRNWYEQVQLAMSRVQVIQERRLAAKAKGLSAKKKQRSMKAHSDLRSYRFTTVSVIEMEVIIGSQGNTIFLDWLEHIRQEIVSKPYSQKSSFWYNAKMRYVYNTTGPKSMARFFKLPANAKHIKVMTYLECNHFKLVEFLTQEQLRSFDVISHESNSYFTKDHEINVCVGPGDKSLPARPTAMRVNVKRATPRMVVSTTGNDGQEGSQPRKQVRNQVVEVSDDAWSVDSSDDDEAPHPPRPHGCGQRCPNEYCYEYFGFQGACQLPRSHGGLHHCLLCDEWFP